MAVSMRCDNCGKFFEYNRTATNAIRFAHFNVSSTGLCNGYTHNETIDLCPECIAAVKNVLKERKDITK